jgi:hypothetical protein
MKQQNVHIFVFDGMSDWEAGYSIAGINNPQFQKNPGSYHVRSVALRNAPIVSQFENNAQVTFSVINYV